MKATSPNADYWFQGGRNPTFFAASCSSDLRLMCEANSSLRSKILGRLGRSPENDVWGSESLIPPSGKLEGHCRDERSRTRIFRSSLSSHLSAFPSRPACQRRTAPSPSPRGQKVIEVCLLCLDVSKDSYEHLLPASLEVNLGVSGLICHSCRTRHGR